MCVNGVWRDVMRQRMASWRHLRVVLMIDDLIK